MRHTPSTPTKPWAGTLLALGLTHAEQIWEEYTYPIIDWAHQQGGIAGFAHMQYLDDSIPTEPRLLQTHRISGRSGIGIG